MPPRKARGGVRGGGWAGTDQGGGLGAGPGEVGDRGAHHHLQFRQYILWLRGPGQDGRPGLEGLGPRAGVDRGGDLRAGGGGPGAEAGETGDGGGCCHLHLLWLPRPHGQLNSTETSGCIEGDGRVLERAEGQGWL